MKKEIYCPKCNWNPPHEPLWMCDCSFVWNTFETNGKCPQCNKKWDVTQCLQEFGGCGQFSPHKEWYYQSGLSFYSKLKEINQRIRWYYSAIKKLRLIGNESDYVWNELKSICKKNELHYGVYEKDNCIVVTLLYDNTTSVEFNYRLNDERKCLEMYVTIAENYDDNQLSQVFTLASHFNTLSANAKVSVYTNEKQVLSVLNVPYTMILLRSNFLENSCAMHFGISKDFFYAFKRLVEDKEDPVFIIADILNRQKSN